MDLIVDLSCSHLKFCAACKHFTGNREVKITSRGEKIVWAEREESYCPKTGKTVRENGGDGCWDYQEI